MLSSLASILSLALLVPSIRAADTVNCKLQFGGAGGDPLVLSKSFGPTDSDSGIYVGLSNATLPDRNGAQARYLTTKKDDGSAFSREDSKFDFYTCDSQYMGYDTENQGKSVTYYGHVAAHVSSPPAKHCLSYQSNDVQSASNNRMLSSLCSFADDKSQVLNYWSLSTYYSAFNFIAHKNETINEHRYVTIDEDGAVLFKYSSSVNSSGDVEYSFVAPH